MMNRMDQGVMGDMSGQMEAMHPRMGETAERMQEMGQPDLGFFINGKAFLAME